MDNLFSVNKFCTFFTLYKSFLQFQKPLTITALSSSCPNLTNRWPQRNTFDMINYRVINYRAIRLVTLLVNRSSTLNVVGEVFFGMA